jgi:hypothetical protein
MNVEQFNEEISVVIDSFNGELVTLENATDYDNVIPQMDAVVENVKSAVDAIYSMCKHKQISATGPVPFGEFVLKAALLLVQHNNAIQAETTGEENATN